MIHNIRFMQRRLDGKSNATALPFAVASLLMLATGLFAAFTNN